MLSDDERWMAAALSLGRRGLGRTAPNPSVGALVVDGGRIVGRGVTGDGGRPHAETVALAQAGPARGATIYVTLEPCSHHGQTPPCCEAIVAAGLGRLVYAMDDPNPLVAGNGASYCRQNGVGVVAGVLRDMAARDHRGHILRVTQQRPMITLKLAETADGFVAGGPHDPRLSITGLAANGSVHVMRGMHDAIMIGIGTALADDPLMTVRLPGVSVRPTRVVLDAQLRIAPRSRLLQTAREGRILVFAGREAIARHGAALTRDNVQVLEIPLTADGRVDLRAALRILSECGITRVFSEGGPTIAAALIEAGLADDVIVITAPRPLGHPGVPTLGPTARRRLEADYRVVDSRDVGVDRLVRYERAA